MGLKDKTSLYDLSQGDNTPVGNMENQQGPSFDLGLDSTLQPDSLERELKRDTDLNGAPGPSFDLGLDSTLQPDSLERQLKRDTDLNGAPGPSFDLGRDSIFHAGGDPVVGTSLIDVYNGNHGSPFTLSLFSAPQSGNPSSRDLNGILPSNGKYESNGPDGGFY